ncbi:MAG TPA: mechanosensitive ion channel family protein [Solirubrobacterales bacterium]|nr:mechanosensitive ion channel family protein [Solirubrobacterales bacterium]
MPAPRRPKMPRDLFETRSHTWQALGLGDELTPRFSKKALGGLLAALVVIAATLVVYHQRAHIAPGYGEWIRIGTVVVLVIVGSAATHWLSKGLAPRMNRRLDPATAGTLGFAIRLLAMSAVVILALRIAGVTASTLAVGGAFTAVVLGLAAQQSLGGIFAGIVLQSTRPFRVGERVRLVGGALAGSLEGTVSSLGLFYTTLSQGADRLLVPNNVLLQLTVVPLREPEKVDVRARFPTDASPQRVERRLLREITVPTRYRPSVSLEELDHDSVVLRVNATPLHPEDGSQLAEEVLEALRSQERAETGEHPVANGASR